VWQDQYFILRSTLQATWKIKVCFLQKTYYRFCISQQNNGKWMK